MHVFSQKPIYQISKVQSKPKSDGWFLIILSQHESEI